MTDKVLEVLISDGWIDSEICGKSSGLKILRRGDEAILYDCIIGEIVCRIRCGELKRFEENDDYSTMVN